MSNNFDDIYIYGEVLFDCFENAEDKLGGAPFNVGWNLRGFGLNPKIITSIGGDSLGRDVLKTMKNWDLDISCVNIIKNKKTGSVSVKVDDEGIPQYDIENDRAYDYIELPPNINNNSLVYHGSLALRNSYNQKQCKSLKETIDSNTFIDINLRDPWWSDKILKESLTNFKWLKLNDEEIPIVCKAFGKSIEDENEQIDFLFENLDFEVLILTKGAQGAVVIDKDRNSLEMAVVKVDNMVDTVGAGDAFSSVVIYGIYNNWDKKTILNRAMKFASKVCSLNGAITDDKNFYNNFLKIWDKESQKS